jgi:hypothetical protein
MNNPSRRDWPTRQQLEAIARDASPDTRLALAIWTVERLASHVADPATYREMVYDRMGFADASGAYEFLLPAQELLNAVTERGGAGR